MTQLVIAPAGKGDIAAIDEIEQHSFKSPWSKQTFEGELLREWARIDVGRLASRPGTPVVSFCNYWLVTPRGAQHRDDQNAKQATFSGELHILAIATHPDFRGRGLGAEMLAHVLDTAIRAGCTLATLEVRRSNRPAIAMYERAGFKTVHVRAAYYQDDGEDALVMLRELTPPAP